MKILDAYRVFFTPLSPVHIGTGESYEPTNYVIEDSTLYEFDTGAAIAALAEKDRKDLLAITSRRPDPGMIKAVQKYFHEQRATLQPWATHRIPVLDGVARLYDRAVGQTANLETGGKEVLNRLEIDRTAYNPIIRQPILLGSSVKGAIRTALLDKVNSSTGLHKTEDRRTGRPRDENNLELQQRLFKYRAGQFELDPMRLLQISDAAWQDKDGLATGEVYLAVNRKKAPVVDEAGALRQSQAENLYQILECVPPLRYRSFAGQINVQLTAGIQSAAKLPDPNLRFNIAALAKACNDFYRPIFDSELALLLERGYADLDWSKAVQNAMRDPRLAEGSAFLLRIGRHSSAESVTLNGVRGIRIMLGKGQPPAFEPTARTLWLAASERDQRTGLLPFGWVLAEFAPLANEIMADNAPLMAICEIRLPAARQWADAMALQQRDMSEARAKIELRRLEEETIARTRAAAEAEAARLLAEQQLRLAAMSKEERSVEDLRKLYVDEARRGVLKPGSTTVGKLNDLLKAADSWPVAARRELTGLAEKIFGDKQVGWGSGDKKRERKDRIAALREKS